jgi:hypothetical protein
MFIMNFSSLLKGILAVFFLGVLVVPAGVRAHSDTLDGPGEGKNKRSGLETVTGNEKPATSNARGSPP